MDRQTDRHRLQAERQTYRPYRLAGVHTDRHLYRQADREIDI